MNQPGPGSSPTLWDKLRARTPARIGLPRTGGSLTTRATLSFAYDQALAANAVHAPFAGERLAGEIRALEGAPEVLELTSAAPDRETYLLRPELGRQLSEAARARLGEIVMAPTEQRDLVIVVSDGLSALAAERQVVPVLRAFLPLAAKLKFQLSPICVVRDARVGVVSEVGQRMGAKLGLILLGERPGLGTPDSLGAYFEYNPRLGNNDAQRNCVSNIRPEGLPPEHAAVLLALWLKAAHGLKLSGVNLKQPDIPALRRR